MGNGVRMLGFGGLALVAMQVFPVDRSAPPDDGPLEISDPVVADIVDRACADCHTNDTRWPWYGYVAPASWFLAKHVEEGRQHLNLSTWSDQSARRQASKLREMVDEVESGEMPLPSYLRGHPEARLTDEERATLIAWAEEMEGQVRGSARRGSNRDDDAGTRDPNEADEPHGSKTDETGGDAEARALGTDQGARGPAGAGRLARTRPHGLSSMVATVGGGPSLGALVRSRHLSHADPVSFSNDILPLFEKKCISCHGGEVDGEIVTESQLDLTTYEAVMAGSEFGPVIEPGDVEGSYLFESVELGDMPEDDDPLSEKEIEMIREWILAGAPNN